jgi:hypothetical protein
VRGSNHPGNMFGALGRSSMVWSHIIYLDSLCNSCSENILLYCWYSARMLGAGSVAPSVGVMVTLSMKYWSWCVSWGLFMDWETKWAFLVSRALRITSSCEESIYPCFQSIFGWVAVNQEYLSIALLSSRLVRKNCSEVHTFSVCTLRYV